ncbi:MAG: hypothetical protein ACRCWR_06180 [Saezia sp.]
MGLSEEDVRLAESGRLARISAVVAHALKLQEELENTSQLITKAREHFNEEFLSLTVGERSMSANMIKSLSATHTSYLAMQQKLHKEHRELTGEDLMRKAKEVALTHVYTLQIKEHFDKEAKLNESALQDRPRGVHSGD